ncbi:DUF4172 domain-containing protein [Mariprofundus erugo]|uniref:DUF4172 domain-containing protein n=1 Tax=Mariprofundus erugo TaxID=2528639 RepID=UPI0010FEC03F|nr:DUF4172 domain-containing protein [Mariprofundus erugo]TLS78357.1 DUF4172 domain-containing protein [Mariprofundus erugo]
MIWNWQLKTWPSFSYAPERLQALEARFLLESGRFFGAFSHFDEQERLELTIELISNEALKSSEIEGEMLNRDSLQSSIRKHFGLNTWRVRLEYLTYCRANR